MNLDQPNFNDTCHRMATQLATGDEMKTTTVTTIMTTAIAATVLTYAMLTHGTTLPANTQAILANAPGLNAHVLQVALRGYNYAKAHGDVKNPNLLTVVDFSLPSNANRLWVIDLQTDKTLMNVPVAQGKNSGLVYATQFSNSQNSDESSLGVYETMDAYSGKHGLSLRINGLEQGLNSNALSRAVIIHPAAYVTPQFIKEYGRAGRSWGCFAVDPAVSQQLVNTIKGGSVIFAYANQENSDPNLITA